MYTDTFLTDRSLTQRTTMTHSNSWPFNISVVSPGSLGVSLNTPRYYTQVTGTSMTTKDLIAMQTHNVFIMGSVTRSDTSQPGIGSKMREVLDIYCSYSKAGEFPYRSVN